MQKMIVTGSEGFIGKALCRHLKERGVEVIEVDRKTGTEADRIEEFIEGVNIVFHLAAQTSVFNEDVEQIKRDNIDTFMKICDVCNRHRVKLVYASSSTANGENTTSMYGISKRFDELYARCYCKTATGVRLHNVYGPHPRKGTLLYNLTEMDEVTLYNYGQNIRCFTYITDAVDGLIYAAWSNKELINLANIQPVTVQYVADLVKRFKMLKTNLVEQKRDFDNLRQEVDRSIYLVPLSYVPIEQGVKLIFQSKGRLG